MSERKLLKPVNFIKVGHHGSHNGTPRGEIFEQILPAKAPDLRKREAVVSTWPGTIYENVPHDPTIERFRKRCNSVSLTKDVEPGDYVDVEFNG